MFFPLIFIQHCRSNWFFNNFHFHIFGVWKKFEYLEVVWVHSSFCYFTSMSKCLLAPRALVRALPCQSDSLQTISSRYRQNYPSLCCVEIILSGGYWTWTWDVHLEFHCYNMFYFNTTLCITFFLIKWY